MWKVPWNNPCDQYAVGYTMGYLEPCIHGNMYILRDNPWITPCNTRWDVPWDTTWDHVAHGVSQVEFIKRHTMMQAYTMVFGMGLPVDPNSTMGFFCGVFHDVYHGKDFL